MQPAQGEVNMNLNTNAKENSKEVSEEPRKLVRVKTLRKVRHYVVDGETRTTLVEKVVREGEERRDLDHFAQRFPMHNVNYFTCFYSKCY